MIFLDPAVDGADDIYCLGDYHPYWYGGQRNPYFDTHSGRILDLKRARDGEEKPAIAYFSRLLEAQLSTGFVVTIVPSSDATKTSCPLRTLAQELVKNHRIDGTGCLVRRTSIQKATEGGSRNVEVHMRTIRIQNQELIRGQEVLVLDDVTTSESSLRACQTLLMQAGAKRVKLAALGKTVYA